METPQAPTSAEIAAAIQQAQQTQTDALAEQLLNVAQILRADMVKLAPTTKVVCSHHSTTQGNIVQFLSKSDTRKSAHISSPTGTAFIASDPGGNDAIEITNQIGIYHLTTAAPMWLVAGDVQVIEEHF